MQGLIKLSLEGWIFVCYVAMDEERQWAGVYFSHFLLPLSANNNLVPQLTGKDNVHIHACHLAVDCLGIISGLYHTSFVHGIRTSSKPQNYP